MHHTASLKQKTTDLGTGSVGKLLFRLAVPTITAQVINVLYNVVDRIYIGHLEGIGRDALTGVGVTLPLITAVSAFAALMSYGGAPKAAIAMGQNDNKTAERIMGNCLVLLVAAAAVLTALVLAFSEPLLYFFGASSANIGYANEYLRIYALGTLFVQLSLGMNAFITTQGFSTFGMLTVAIGAVCNIVLDPVFMFGFGLGVAGAAWATILSQFISSVFVLWFLRSRRTILKLRLPNLRPSLKIMGASIALGLSPFTMQFTESVLFICFNRSLRTYGGDLAVGAMTILSSVMQFSMLPLQGLTQGSQPLVSYNFGAGKTDRVKKTFRLLLVSSLAYSTALWALAVFAPQVLAGMFTNNAELLEYTSWALRIYMAMSLIFGAQIACQQTFVALGSARISLFLALLRKVFLLIPLIFILPQFFAANADKAMAVFLAEPVADTIAVCTTCTVFFFTYRKLEQKAAKVL